MDSRITYCRLRLFSRDFAELYTVFRQWNTAYRRLRALNTCFCSVREFHPYFHHRVQALFGLSVFIPRFRDGCTETTRTCSNTAGARIQRTVAQEYHCSADQTHYADHSNGCRFPFCWRRKLWYRFRTCSRRFPPA